MISGTHKGWNDSEVMSILERNSLYPLGILPEPALFTFSHLSFTDEGEDPWWGQASSEDPETLIYLAVGGCRNCAYLWLGTLLISFSPVWRGYNLLT